MRKRTSSRRARRQVLMLVPSVPSPGLAAAEKELFRAVTAVSGAHSLLCVPQEQPLSARLDEAALASRGAEIYSFRPRTAEGMSENLKTIITANPGLDVAGFAGLPALRLHLVDARLFAPAKSFFAVLGRGDLAELRAPGPGGTAPGEENRRLLSCCDAVFCPDAAGARFLRERFGAPAHVYDSIAAVISGLGGRSARAALKLGLIFKGPAPAASGPFRVARRNRVLPREQLFAAANRAILKAPSDIRYWAVVPGDLQACGSFWERLSNTCRVFPGAGLVLPSDAGFQGRPPAAALEALSLARQGSHGEPLLAEAPPAAVIMAEAFRRVGGFDERFSSPSCAWTDLGLRMRQAGFGTVSAGDAVACAPKPRPAPQADIDLLTHKWCADGLKIMELLAFELGGLQP